MADGPEARVDAVEDVLVHAFLDHHALGLVVAAVAEGRAARDALVDLHFAAGAVDFLGLRAEEVEAGVEGLDFEDVFGFGVQAVQLEGIGVIDDVAVVELARLDAVTDDVAVGARDGIPEELRFAAVFRVADDLDAGEFDGAGGRRVAEDAQVLDAELGAVMALAGVGDLHEAALGGLGELRVVVVQVQLVGGLVDDRGPAVAVHGHFHLEALVEFGVGGGRTAEAAEAAAGGLLGADVVPVALDGVDVGHLAEVDLVPFTRIAGGGGPVGQEVLVHGVLRDEVLEGGGDGDFLLEGEEFPAGPVVVHRVGAGARPELRVVAEFLVGMHHARFIDGRREDGELGAAACAAVAGRNHADGPELAVLVMEGAAVAGAHREARGLEGQRVVLRVGEGAHGAVGHIDAVRVGEELQADGGVLEVVFPVVLGHPGTFDPWIFLFEVVAAPVEDGVDHVVVGALLEAVLLVVAEEEDFGAGDFLEGFLVQLDDLEGHELGPAVVEVEPAVVIDEHVGVAVAVAVEGADLLPGACLGVDGLIDVLVVHGASVQAAVHFHDGDHAARIVRGVHVGPVLEVGGVPVALAVRDEEEIVVLIDQHDGLSAPVGTLAGYDQVERVAERVLSVQGEGQEQGDGREYDASERFGVHMRNDFGFP